MIKSKEENVKRDYPFMVAVCGKTPVFYVAVLFQITTHHLLDIGLNVIIDKVKVKTFELAPVIAEDLNHYIFVVDGIHNLYYATKMDLTSL